MIPGKLPKNVTQEICSVLFHNNTFEQSVMQKLRDYARDLRDLFFKLMCLFTSLYCR